METRKQNENIYYILIKIRIELEFDLSLNDKVKKGAEFGMKSKRKIKQILFDVCHHHFRCVRCLFHISQLFTSMHNSTCYRIMDTADKQTNKNQIPSFSIKHYLPMMTCTDHSPVFFFFFFPYLCHSI